MLRYVAPIRHTSAQGKSPETIQGNRNQYCSLQLHIHVSYKLFWHTQRYFFPQKSICVRFFPMIFFFYSDKQIYSNIRRLLERKFYRKTNWLLSIAFERFHCPDLNSIEKWLDTSENVRTHGNVLALIHIHLIDTSLFFLSVCFLRPFRRSITNNNQPTFFSEKKKIIYKNYFWLYFSVIF